MSKKQKRLKGWGWFLVIFFGLGLSGSISMRPFPFGTAIFEICCIAWGIHMIMKSKKLPYVEQSRPVSNPVSNVVVTVTCPACGAPAKVPKGSSVVCEYCGTMVEDKK